MTVVDLTNEMILGQKYAVECEYILIPQGDDAPFTWETYHFEIGGGSYTRCDFGHDVVDYFRVVSNEIYIHIHRLIHDLDEVIPSKSN